MDKTEAISAFCAHPKNRDRNSPICARWCSSHGSCRGHGGHSSGRGAWRIIGKHVISGDRPRPSCVVSHWPRQHFIGTIGAFAWQTSRRRHGALIGACNSITTQRPGTLNEKNFLPSGGYLGTLESSSASGSRSFFIFWGCNMVPVPCSIIGPPRVLGQVPPERKLSRSLLRFFLAINWAIITTH